MLRLVAHNAGAHTPWRAGRQEPPGGRGVIYTYKPTDQVN